MLNDINEKNSTYINNFYQVHESKVYLIFVKEVFLMIDEMYEGIEEVINELLNEYREYVEQDKTNGDDPSYNQGAVEALEELLYRLSED